MWFGDRLNAEDLSIFIGICRDLARLTICGMADFLYPFVLEQGFTKVLFLGSNAKLTKRSAPRFYSKINENMLTPTKQKTP